MMFDRAVENPTCLPAHDSPALTGAAHGSTFSPGPLPEHVQQLCSAMDALPGLVWLSDGAGARHWFNRSWLAFTGRAGTTGPEWIADLHADDRARHLQTFRIASTAGEPFETEYRLRRHDGVYHWVHCAGTPVCGSDGTIVGYVGFCIDVSDRKRSEAALLERVQQHTLELRGANELLQRQIEERRRIQALLATENRILELVAAGVDRERPLTALCAALGNLIPEARCVIRLAPANGAPEASTQSAPPPTPGLDLFGALASEETAPPVSRERVMIAHVRPDDPLLTCGVQAYWLQPIIGSGDVLLGTLAVYQRKPGRPDEAALSAGTMAARLAAIVVERARAEERAREQLAQLAHVARLATMGELASGLAHELNQPLCAIVNFTEACVELVKQDGLDRGQFSQALGEVSKQAARAGAVIRRLRGFVKRGEPQRQAVEINGLIRDVAAFTAVEARHNDVRVRLRLAKRPPKVFADAIQVQQILVNLMRNAIEAMRDCALAARTLTIETAHRQGEVEVLVGDSGPGIPEEVRQRLFEPFFTTKQNGLGMGLSISRSILEVHDGRIWASTNQQGGTTFHFTLPTAWRARHERRHGLRGG